MTVAELINKLSSCRPTAEVKARAGFEHGPRHYTVDLLTIEDEPVMVFTHRVDGEDVDHPNQRPDWLDMLEG